MQILKVFHPVGPGYEDRLSGGQLFVVMRLVIHALQGKQVDKDLAFSQSMFPPAVSTAVRDYSFDIYFIYFIQAHPKSMQKAASEKPPNAPREHHPPIASSSSAMSQTVTVTKIETSTVVPARHPVSDGVSSSGHDVKFGDVVLAKLRGYPPWPGIVSGGGFCIVPIH